MTETPTEIYRSIFHETPNPTVITDESFSIVDVNQACLEFTGYTREELLGSPPLFLVNDSQTYEEMVDTLAAGEPWEGELEAVTKYGERVFGYGATFPLITDDELVGYAGIFIDLSERRRSEQTVSVLNRVLRHNIRNDANVIGGVLSTVKHAVSGVERELVEKALERIERLLDRAETARDLHELLERSSTALVPRDLCTVIETTAPKLVDERTTLHLDVPDDPVWILADDALSRGVAAVVENAVEYNQDASPMIWIHVETTPDEVVLTVEDNGPGIEPEQAEFLFGQCEDSQLRHGQGLSLFFVDRLLDFYGGSVTYRSRSPTGSIFELRFRHVSRPT
ncbi:PAS domain S-box protein [Halogeometricum borinquense]|uniref:histidine kinase n=1 Tax=Halogeometricum borinquense TaxID=60847 RepID=A0A6C0UK43_9EURY|nr:PAS domain-containing sensor histidine kinase [Halogeometricum borinquense]QIB75872.1 PAS domain S-box protein [Halogeometricum borinquense]QIQ75545.1 PAS domain S-box protein [Halogeometricum borinquense]